MNVVNELYKLKDFDFDPQIKHVFFGGTYAKRMSLPKDAGVAVHVHDFDHLSILAKGKIALFTDDKRTEHEAGDWIEMKKGVRHGLVALEDSIWFCINVDS